MTLEERIETIEKRNRLVEQNKAWETSWTRKTLIAMFTYVAIVLYIKFILGINPWVTAIVPTVGFLLSTLTLSWFKDLWIQHIYGKKKETLV